MTPLGYNKTIMEEFGEIVEMTTKMTAKMNSCPLCGFEEGHSLSCPRYEHKTFEEYDAENTDETAEELEKRFNQSVEDKHN